MDARKIRIEALKVSFFLTNCYIVGIDGSSAFIVDPGDEARKIKEVIKKHNFKPLFIINTHGHIDHIKEDATFNLPIFIHSKDVPLLFNPELNLSSYLSTPFKITNNLLIRRLEDKDFLEFEGMGLEIIHTPGHTQGSICIKFGNYLFSGDTLFSDSIGRTDFKGGNQKLLIDSVKKKLFCLDDNLTVFPGHGPKTILGREKRENPFFNPSQKSPQL